MVHPLSSPVTEQDLARLDDRPEYLWMDRALTEADYELLGRWMGERPQKGLSVRSYDPALTDLDLLRWFPTLRRLEVDADSLASLDGLRFLPDDLEELALGATRRRVSLRPISRFSGLRRLHLEGHTKDVNVICGLTSLVELSLRSVTLPGLDALLPLEHLESLDLKLGGTTNLAALPDVGRLRRLELWMVRGLSDLSPLGDLQHLEHLHLQALRRVETLPDLSGAVVLQRVWLDTLKGLTDLRPLATAPALRHLALIAFGHLQPEDLIPLLDSPSLRSVRVGLGSDRKNDRARVILGELATED